MLQISENKVEDKRTIFNICEHTRTDSHKDFSKNIRMVRHFMIVPVQWQTVVVQ
jgi:hypothetical protein